MSNKPQQLPFTDLDSELQNLALIDWDTFRKLVGEDAIINAKACILKSRGKSLAQIGQRLGITKRQSSYRCESCNIPDQFKLARHSNQ